MVTCGQGHVLPDALGSEPADQRTPCPECGSTLRRTSVSATDALGPVRDSTSFEVHYAPGRPWQEQWRVVLERFERLQAACSGRVTGIKDTFQLGRVAVDFCEDCHHLKDWLQSDPAVPAAVQGLVETHRRADKSLTLTGHVANTNKHHGRALNLVRAQVDAVAVRDGGRASITIGWTDPDTAQSGSRDALDLATDSVAAWRTFFANHSLSEL